jgi:hypothetical protein
MPRPDWIRPTGNGRFATKLGDHFGDQS